MFQPYLFQDESEPLSVSDVNARVKAIVEDDDALADVRVSGELGNITRHSSGHVYFVLKDAASQLKCVMWRANAIRLRTLPSSGDRVVVRGQVKVFERDGVYQLYAASLLPVGVGDLFAQFELLKQRLVAEGLFDASRKRPLPQFPRRLGVVTSPTGAALQDVLNVLRRRFPLVEVVLAPAQVQGADAPPTIVRALATLNTLSELDVVLVTRGGGSMEDLWAFNDERVVRAIAASRAPIVSGVGHEIDVTLADLAADVRAPTPSAAAELMTPNADDLRLQTDALATALDDALAAKIGVLDEQLRALARGLRMLSPASHIMRARERLDDVVSRLDTGHAAALQLRRAQLGGLRARLDAISPWATLARGYAIVLRAGDGAVVRSVGDVADGDALRVRVGDGEFPARAGASL